MNLPSKCDAIVIRLYMKQVVPHYALPTLTSDDELEKLRMRRVKRLYIAQSVSKSTGFNALVMRTIAKTSYKYRDVWRRACFRIKARKALSIISDEIVLYGTSSDFVDFNNHYRPNADQILWKKQHKQENFRNLPNPTSDEMPWHVINPVSTFSNTWSIILLLLLLYTASIMPVRVAYYDVVFFDAWTILDLIIDCFFTLDVFVNCVTAYVKRDELLEINHKKIFCKYAKTWLLFDMISCLPFSFIEYGTEQSNSRGEATHGRYSDLIRLARVPRLYKLLRILRIAKAFNKMRNNRCLSNISDYLITHSRKT